MNKYLVIKYNGERFRLAKLRVKKDEFYWFGPGSKKPVKIFQEKSDGKNILINKEKMKCTKSLECHFSWHKDGEMHLAMKDKQKNIHYESVVKAKSIQSLGDITPFAIFVPAKSEYYSYKPIYDSEALLFDVRKGCLDRLVFEFAICPNELLSVNKKNRFCSIGRCHIKEVRTSERQGILPDNYFFKFDYYTLYVGIYCVPKLLNNKYSQFYSIYVEEA